EGKNRSEMIASPQHVTTAAIAIALRIIIAANEPAPDRQHLAGDVNRVAYRVDAAAPVVAPRDAMLDDHEAELARDDEDLEIEPPPRGAHALEDRLRGTIGEQLEATL